MIASTEEAAWKALPQSLYLLESHGEKICVYLVKTKTSLQLEGLDTALFLFFDKHDRCSLSDLAKHVTIDPKNSDYSLDSSLQKLAELGLIQTATL